MSVFFNHFLSEMKKQVYYLIFPIIRRIKYSKSVIKSRHIHPSAKIGHHVVIERECRISKGVEIHDYTYMNEGVRVDSNTRSIGRYCSISHNVKIGLGPHPAHFVSTSAVFYNPHWGFVSEVIFDEIKANGSAVIEDDVLIGASAIILAGVHVGTGAIIGAGAIVTKDVEPYTVVGGAPARKLGDRFPEDIKSALLQSRWWEWPAERLLKEFPMGDPAAFLERWKTASRPR
jgi:acetyltransferase-like isoleucine patch superfamily enzyme